MSEVLFATVFCLCRDSLHILPSPARAATLQLQPRVPCLSSACSTHATVEEALHSRFESELVGFRRARSPRAKKKMCTSEKGKA